MKHWLKLEEQIGYNITRVIAYIIYLSFYYDRDKTYWTARKVVEYFEYLPYKTKKIVETNFPTILSSEIEDMKLTDRRNLDWLIERYKL